MSLGLATLAKVRAENGSLGEILPTRSEPPKLPSLYDNKLSQRLTVAHAHSIGAEAGDLIFAEVESGKRLDHRVSLEQAHHLQAINKAAQRDFFRDVHSIHSRPSTKVLLATTARAVDYFVSSDMVPVLVETLIADGREKELRDAINSGYTTLHPESKREALITDPVHLVSEIVRWSVEHGAQKHRLRAAPALRVWVRGVLNESGVALRPRLGGISAVDTIQGMAIGDRTTMMALGSIPEDVRRFLPPHTPVVGDNADWRTLQDIPTEGQSAGHFCILSPNGHSILPPALTNVSVDGRSVSREAITKLDLIVSGGSTVPGFGDLSAERLLELGKQHELVVLTGAQMLGKPAEVQRYFEAVEQLHKNGAAIALCYSEPRYKEHEMAIWNAVRASNSIEFFGLNSGEASELLERMYSATKANNPLKLSEATIGRLKIAVEQAAVTASPFGPGPETPKWLYHCATVLQEILDIPAVRVRGKNGDVLVVGAEVVSMAPDRVRDSLLVSRNLGTIKVATPAGLITERGKLTFLKNPPSGVAMAMLHAVADEARGSGGARSDGRELTTKGFVTLADGRRCFFVPPTPFFIKDGGTASAGDTMDYTFASRESRNLLVAAQRVNCVRARSSESEEGLST